MRQLQDDNQWAGVTSHTQYTIVESEEETFQSTDYNDTKTTYNQTRNYTTTQNKNKTKNLTNQQTDHCLEDAINA